MPSAKSRGSLSGITGRDRGLKTHQILVRVTKLNLAADEEGKEKEDHNKGREERRKEGMKEGRQKKHKGRKDMEPLIAAKPKTNVPVLICQWGHVSLGVTVTLRSPRKERL